MKKSSGEGKSFLIGRNSVTGELMSVKDARKDPTHTQVERMPKKGYGDSPKKK
jgi:hypothetical protein